MVSLHQTQSNWSRDERNRINENWQRITGAISNLQNQIAFFLNGEEIEDLLNRINQAVSESENMVDEVSNALTGIRDAIDNANIAAADANALVANLNTLKLDLETLQVDLQGIYDSENARIDAENNRNTAEQQRITNETARQQTLTTMTSVINEFVWMGEYSPGVTYKKYNLVQYKGSSFAALQDVSNIRPSDDGVNWRLVAEKGEMGTGINILGNLASENDLPATANIGDAYLIEGNLYIWSGEVWENVGNIKGPKGDTGDIGPQGLKGDTGAQGPPGNDADVTELTQTVTNLQQTVTDNKTEVTEHLAESSLKHIHSSGSNANGHYIKFDDGTIICYATNKSITSAPGGPQTSVALPHEMLTTHRVALVTISNYANDSKYRVNQYVEGDVTSNNIVFKILVWATSEASPATTVQINYQVIGRWK